MDHQIVYSVSSTTPERQTNEFKQDIIIIDDEKQFGKSPSLMENDDDTKGEDINRMEIEITSRIENENNFQKEFVDFSQGQQKHINRIQSIYSKGRKKLKADKISQQGENERNISDFYEESGNELVQKEKDTKSDSEKNSKSKKKAYLKEVERFNKAVIHFTRIQLTYSQIAELEKILNNLEKTVPPEQLKIVDYIQSINMVIYFKDFAILIHLCQKRPFASRLHQVIEFYNKIQSFMSFNSTKIVYLFK